MPTQTNLRNDPASKPIALGMSANQWVKLLSCDQAKATQKALDYLDGKQLKHVQCVLDDPAKGRRHWRKKGIIPRYRNITDMVVNRSAMLFKDSLPIFNVFTGENDTVNARETKFFQEQLWQIEFAEFLGNLDKVTRLVKTAVVLVQYDFEEQHLTLDILTRANCAVVVAPGKQEIQGLIYVVSTNKAMPMYRIITRETIIDLVDINNVITVSEINSNPYGVVPACPFYDTSIPRSGFWIETDFDLVEINEAYNLALTDSEYSVSWQKIQTLFTNMRISSDRSQSVQTQMNPTLAGDTTPAAIVGGPGSVVEMDSQGVDGPFIEYKGPTTDLTALDDVVNGWVKAIAYDWAVRVKVEGGGTASSGFQLIVEEMDNLDLRRQRQRMFENGFKRLFRNIKQVFGFVQPGAFNADSQIDVKFAEPFLPVDIKQQEEVWSQRISENRATEIDYFMHVNGLTKEEAELKFIEILSFNAKKVALARDLDLTTTPQEEPAEGEENEESQEDAPDQV